MSITLRTHQRLMGLMLTPSAPSRLQKIASIYNDMGTLGVEREMQKRAAAARRVEVSDVIGLPSPAHPGHMSNVEADVIDEAVRQREKAMKKRADEQVKTLAYLMSIEGGEEFIKAAIEQGEAQAAYLLEHDPEEAMRIAKTAFNVSPELKSIARAGMTAADIEKAVGQQTLRNSVGRAAVLAPVGYFAGRAAGSNPKQKEQLGNIGMIAGALGGPASALAGASSLGGEVGQLKLLERGMNAPAADAMAAGSSFAREKGIRRGAVDILKERAPKTAEVPQEPSIDSSAPGSLLAHLAKEAGLAGQGFLRELPVGRLLAGAGAGAIAGNLAAGKDKKHEARYTMLGALGGAGLAHGFAPAAAEAAGKELGSAAGHEAGSEVAAGFNSKRQHLQHAANIVESEHKLYGGVDFARLDNELSKAIPTRHERESVLADVLAHPRYGKMVKGAPAGFTPLSETYDFAGGEPQS